MLWGRVCRALDIGGPGAWVPGTLSGAGARRRALVGWVCEAACVVSGRLGPGARGRTFWMLGAETPFRWALCILVLSFTYPTSVFWHQNAVWMSERRLLQKTARRSARRAVCAERVAVPFAARPPRYFWS